jgi:capsular polysaccharide export protein
MPQELAGKMEVGQQAHVLPFVALKLERQAVEAEARPIQGVPANPALLTLAQAQRVLLLQGPVGPFFDRLTNWLRGRGTAVHRVVFQGGDRHDCQALKPIEYRGSPADWPAACARICDEVQPQVIVLFGQARYYHVQAMRVARERGGIAIVVLEEGYFRPGYLTMELDGVNGYSTTLQRYQWTPDKAQGVQLDLPEQTEGQFKRMAWHAAMHYGFIGLQRQRFPNYQHHKVSSVPYYWGYWGRSWLRKFAHKWLDDKRVRQLQERSYYFVPLQHDGDSQITHHSPYKANTEFILQVLTSFAEHAPGNTWLVFRQHPHARGGAGHAKLIYSLAKELGVADRVLHLVEGHTPTLVDNALAVVVINSTVGLQALKRDKPLKVMGEALYRVEGLSFQGELHQFWNLFRKPDTALRDQVLTQIRHLTQVPCNVYAFRDEPLRWELPAAPDAAPALS